MISSRIIGLFREHRVDALRALQNEVNAFTPCQEEKINKVFSRLIMLYHPDRLNQFLVRIDEAYGEGDFESLYAMSHILTVQNLEPELATLSAVITEEDLAEEFGWDDQADAYSYFMDQDGYDQEMEEELEYTNRSFLIALKRRIYGNLNVDFPMYLLEDMEEIEMADYDIESLEGIEACRYVRVVDLTNNNLTDLTGLESLQQIERLYLANNHIGMIDSLSNLTMLQVLDISYNDVDDLSPLFELSHLTYLNVMGNRIPAWQIEKMQQQGVTMVI
ncbi:MAG: leucine-rich repeat domain-containing protein [Bacteroidota bacterium]